MNAIGAQTEPRYYISGAGLFSPYIKVDCMREIVLLSQPYPELILRWEFNSSGRLNVVSCMRNASGNPIKSVEERTFQTLVRIIGYNNPLRQRSWTEEKADLFPLPLEKRCINPKFESLPYYSQYYSLFTFGHKGVRELLERIACYPPFVPSPGTNRFPLVHLARDALAFPVLQSAAVLYPFVHVENERSATIEYKTRFARNIRADENHVQERI